MAAHKLQGRMKLYGFEISIENAKGSVRRWYDPHGKEKGHTKMYFDYGYIRGTKGTDGDHVDVYVGPNPESDRVFIVNQMKKPPTDTGGAWTKFDEQKVMLAFKDAEAAKSAYLKQYDDPRFFGSMKEMPVTDFKAKVLDRENHGKKISKLLHIVGGGVFGGAAADSQVGVKEANGDMLQYFADHPEKLKEKQEREAREKRAARLLAELNLAKLAMGEPVVLPSQMKLARNDILGEGTPGITVLPAITNYAQATMSKQERKEADREMKTAAKTVLVGAPEPVSKNMQEYTAVHVKHLPDEPTLLIHNSLVKGFYEAGGEKGTWADQAEYLKPHIGTKVHGFFRGKKASDRAGRIADRIDDVGIGLLAAPYAASAAGHSLARAKNPKLKALGTAVEKGFGTESSFGKSHGREIAGLAMVAPGVTHTLAKGIDKATSKKAELEKIAQRFFEDYEYKTEAEKTAILALLGRVGGLAARSGGAVAGAGRAATSAVGQAAGRASSGLSGAVARAGDKLKGGFISGQRGVSQQVGERAARMARTPGSAISKVPAVAPPASVAAGGVPTPVATTAASGGLSPKWNPLSARNLVMGGGAAALGLGAYGGYKGIQTASNLLQTTHEAPLAPPGFAGTGRVF